MGGGGVPAGRRLAGRCRQVWAERRDVSITRVVGVRTSVSRSYVRKPQLSATRDDLRDVRANLVGLHGEKGANNDSGRF